MDNTTMFETFALYFFRYAMFETFALYFFFRMNLKSVYLRNILIWIWFSARFLLFSMSDVLIMIT